MRKERDRYDLIDYIGELASIVTGSLFLSTEVFMNFCMTMPSYETQEEVMFFDTDIGGVVHNIAYLRMIETCRTKMAVEKMGMNLKQMADSNLYPVVVRTEIDYKFPATLGHKLTIKGKLESLERVKFWVSFEIYAEGIERCLITCRQALAMVKMPEGRPQRLSTEWREKWGS